MSFDSEEAKMAYEWRAMTDQASEIVNSIDGYMLFLYIKDAVPRIPLTSDQENRLAQWDYVLAKFDNQLEQV